MDKTSKNNPKSEEVEHELKQLNGTIRQPSVNANLDSNYNTLKEGFKSNYEPQKIPIEETKEEVKILKTPTYERRYWIVHISNYLMIIS